MSHYTAKDLKRFWSNIDVLSPDECWNWKLKPNQKGYGSITIQKKKIKAHRLAYELSKNESAGDLMVCHSCDNRLCCNPAHLFLGTALDNSEDMTNKERQARGEKQGKHKLTSNDVVLLRADYATGEYTYRELAVKFGISPGQVSKIINGEFWKHI